MSYIPISSKAETVAVAATAIGFTAANYVGASKAEVDVQSASIRFYADGSTPTATAGVRVPRNGKITLRGAEIAGFKAIRETGVSATLSVIFYSGEPGVGE